MKAVKHPNPQCFQANMLPTHFYTRHTCATPVRRRPKRYRCTLYVLYAFTFHSPLWTHGRTTASNWPPHFPRVQGQPARPTITPAPRLDKGNAFCMIIAPLRYRAIRWMDLSIRLLGQFVDRILKYCLMVQSLFWPNFQKLWSFHLSVLLCDHLSLSKAYLI